MKRSIKVLVVDDHPLVRKGVILCLSNRNGIKIVGETGEGGEVVGLAQDLQADVVLMDIDLPHTCGLTVTRQLSDLLPTIKVLVLSIHENPGYICRAVQAGARGYIFKHAPVQELVNAVRVVHQGEVYFTDEMVRLTIDQCQSRDASCEKHRLTDREQEVLVKIAEGWSNKEIAGQLGVGLRTVEFHRGQLRYKLNLQSTAEMTRFAVAQGWVSAEQGALEPEDFPPALESQEAIRA